MIKLCELFDSASLFITTLFSIVIWFELYDRVYSDNGAIVAIMLCLIMQFMVIVFGMIATADSRSGE